MNRSLGIRSRSMYAVLTLLALARAASAAPPPTIHERILESPPAEVWRLWTTSIGLEEWLAARASIDLRLGGEMATRYRADGELGDGRTIGNRILSFEPERMLSIQVSKTPDGFPFEDVVDAMWTVIDLEPVDGGRRTRIRIAGYGFGEGESFERLRAFFHAGNGVTLDRLAERIAAGKPLPPEAPALAN